MGDTVLEAPGRWVAETAAGRAGMNRLFTWASMVIGVYLLCCRYLVGGSAGAVWSAYLAGSVILVAGVFALALPRARGVLAIRILSGAWLLASPFVFGFGGAAAASAWVAGTLLVGTGEPRRALFALAAAARVALLTHGVKTLSPCQVSSARCHDTPPEPEFLARRIVECSAQIRATMLGDPSDTDAEICLTGYRSCVDDMVTLAALVAEERARSGALRRFRLRMIRSEASYSLARARETLPDTAGAARAPRVRP